MLLGSRSEIAADDGWLWLRPRRASTRLHHSFASFLLAVLVLTGAAAATLLPPLLAVPTTAAAAVAVVWLVLRTAREGQTRVGLCEVGVLLQDGSFVVQVGWQALRGLRGVAAGSRVRIAVDAGTDSRTTRTAFDRDAARGWLERAAREARRRNLQPQAVDTGLGFTAGE